MNHVVRELRADSCWENPGPWIKVPLFQHQAAAFYHAALSEIESMGYNVVGQLYDPPGYGKTLTALSIAGLPVPNTIPCRQYGLYWDALLQTDMHRGNLLPGKTLIVVPKVLFEQWKSEIAEKTNLRCAFVFDHWAFKRLLRERSLRSSLELYDCVVVSDRYLVRQRNATIGLTQSVFWSRVIVDEYHMLSPSVPSLYTRTFWQVTGTPSVFDYAHIWWSGRRFFNESGIRKREDIMFCTIRSSRDFLRQSYTYPTPIIKMHLSLLTGRLGALYTVLDPESRVLLNTQDYDRAMRFISRVHNFTVPEGGDFAMVFKKSLEDSLDRTRALLTRAHKESYVKELQDKVADLERKITRVDNVIGGFDGECPVCFAEVPEERRVTLGCMHTLCTGCCVRCFKDSSNCPVCREAVTSTTTLNASLSIPEDNLPRTKREILEDIIAEILRRDHFKVVVFSENRELLEEFEAEYSNRLRCMYIQYHRPADIKRYTSPTGDVDVVFTTTGTCFGINLQCTTDLIVFNESENQGVSAQILGRCNRIPRVEPLRVHMIVTQHGPR